MVALSDRFKIIAAVYVVFRNGDKVLLLRRFNTGYRDGQYSLPAGHVDGGEAAIAAACREAKEEVGVTLTRKDLHFVHAMHRKSADPQPHERIDLYFEADSWAGELRNAEPDKCDELRWVELDDLPENMVPEVALALKKIQAKEVYSDFNF